MAIFLGSESDHWVALPTHEAWSQSKGHFPHEKTTFQWSKVVFEAILPTNMGYVWELVLYFFGGTEGEEKAIYTFPHSRFGHFQWPKQKSKTTSTNIPLISGKYGLKNHFGPLESGLLMRKSEKKGPTTRLKQNFSCYFLEKLALSLMCH